MTALTRSTVPLQVTLGISPERASWLLARGLQRLPAGYFAICAWRDGGDWLEPTAAPAP